MGRVRDIVAVVARASLWDAGRVRRRGRISRSCSSFVYLYMPANHDPLPPVGAEFDEAVDLKLEAPASAEALVRAFNQSLVRVLQLRLGSYEDAREVAQEAYARLDAEDAVSGM